MTGVEPEACAPFLCPLALVTSRCVLGCLFSVSWDHVLLVLSVD